MKRKLFDELLQSAKEAIAIERGNAKPSRAFKIKSASGLSLCPSGAKDDLAAIRQFANDFDKKEWQW
jgi:hypothetical protein